MPPEGILPLLHKQGSDLLPRAWQRPLLALMAAWLVLFLAFAPDWQDMASQWWNISTYAHILLVPVIVAWLVWQDWPTLRGIEPQAWWPGLIVFGCALLLWLLGAFANLDIVRQEGAVGLLIGAVPCLLGARVGRVLLFPLAYMVFLVPFGDELVPPLQLITAKLTIGLVELSGIPAVIDGVFISTPAGLFEVAEACSGVKFLVAMIAFGVLACHVCFRSWHRRAGFMILCVAAPVLANGVRAWGTVYMAQFVGAERASGYDHIIYGWFFFAAVIALVIALGWRFFDRPPGAPLVEAEAVSGHAWMRLDSLAIGQGRAMLAMAAMVALALGWAHAAERLSASIPAQIFLPDVPGWQRVDYKPRIWWEPRARGADHRLLGRYADGRGHQVDVFIALYSRQTEGSKAGGYGEGALTPDSLWQWLAPGDDVSGAKVDRLLSKAGVERLSETRYRHGYLLTGSDARLRLAVLADRLMLRARPTMTLILSAEALPGNSPVEALAAFQGSIGNPGAWLNRVGEGR